MLKLRWIVEPGDVIFLDCTSGDPERQFKAWSRWHKYHPEWTIDYEKKYSFGIDHHMQMILYGKLIKL